MDLHVKRDRLYGMPRSPHTKLGAAPWPRVVWSRVATNVVLVLVCLFFLLPLAWIILSSFKSNQEIFKVPFQWLPTHWMWSNYSDAFQAVPLGRYFVNSIVVSVVITAANIYFDAMVGYALAQFRFPGRSALFVFILATMMLPIQVIIIPLFLIVKGFGWLNSYAGLIVPGLMSAFGIFLMRQWFLSFPRDLAEAARVDGAAEWTIFHKIVLPSAGPAISALAIFIFMGSWNSFLWPLVVVNEPSLMTLPLGLASFLGEYQTAYNELIAVSLLSMVPTVLVFLLFQRHFVQGITTTGLKA